MLKTVCAICKATFKIEPGPDEISHGYCEKCGAEELKKFEEFKIRQEALKADGK